MLKFVCGILNFFFVVKFIVDLTALSAWSFPFGFYGISTTIDYLMSNLVYTYILNIFD